MSTLKFEDDRTVFKLCDKETLMKEREQKLILAERKKAEELKRKQELLEAQVCLILRFVLVD